MQHSITRHRQEPKRHTLTVAQKTELTPGMIRLVLAGRRSRRLCQHVAGRPRQNLRSRPSRCDRTPRLHAAPL